MSKNNQLPVEGIYFNMSFGEYLKCPAISRSFAEAILFDKEEAKYLLENPIKATPAMDLGTAIHSAILEEEDFKNSYICRPNPKDYTGKILYTAEDLKPLLEAFGLKKSGKKGDLIASLKEYINPAEFVIWDDVLETFEREAEISGKKILSENDSIILDGLRSKMNNSPEIKQLFDGGYPEITLIWKDKTTGILCKCRLDYLRPDAIGELKSFSVKNKKIPLLKTMCREIENNRYNLQFAIYLNALEQLIDSVNEGKAQIFGKPDPEFLAELLATNKKRSFIVFVRTAAPFQMRSFEIQRSETEGGSMNQYFSVANEKWLDALYEYRDCLKNGFKNQQEPIILNDSHLPSIMYQI